MPQSITTASANLKKNQLDLREMLLTAGVGQFSAIMCIPFMNMLVTTTEPYAQGVQLMVQGLQRMLNQRGAKLVVDGGMGDRTQKAIEHYSGPRWSDKSWAQIYGDVISGVPWQGYKRNARGNDEVQWFGAERALEGPEDILFNPFVLAAGAFAVWWKFFKKG